MSIGGRQNTRHFRPVPAYGRRMKKIFAEWKQLTGFWKSGVMAKAYLKQGGKGLTAAALAVRRGKAGFLFYHSCMRIFSLFSPRAIHITATAKNSDHRMPGMPERYCCGRIVIPVNEKNEKRMPGII